MHIVEDFESDNVPLLHFNLPIDPEVDVHENSENVNMSNAPVKQEPFVKAAEPQTDSKFQINSETKVTFVSPLLAPTVETEAVPLMPLTTERSWFSKVFFCCAERK